MLRQANLKGERKMTLSDKGFNFYGRKLPIHTCNDYFMDIDIKRSIKKINKYIKEECICHHCQKIIKVINDEVGDALCTSDVVEDKNGN